jgi:predicted AAA+ superfamily ATPase
MKERGLRPLILQDLGEKMVLLSGPRQVGKTTLVRSILGAAEAGVYLNWDHRGDRRAILAAAWPPAPALIVLDELHKYRQWKRWLKGEFDRYRDKYQFLVTGSARLDIYRKGGDSLQGRYHHLRLHPFSVAELLQRVSAPVPFEPLPIRRDPDSESEAFLGQLLARGGFPEPLFAATERGLRRWHQQRLDRFFREDVRELEQLRDLSSIELLADALPERVGGPLSVNALREDLEVSHRAVSHWLEILERLYFSYRLPPYTARTIRGLRKENKAYLWEWSQVPTAGPRFENLVASHLLKLCHHLEDVEGYRTRLHYVRDRDGREVDFLVTVNKKPWFLLEAKLDDHEPSRHLHYFRDRLDVPFCYQLVRTAGHNFVRDGIHVISAAHALAALV